MESKNKVSKKKQTASSLQRIEQTHQFGKLSNYNKISSNISNNEFSASVHDNDGDDLFLGKKKTSAMNVLEFAKVFKNKGEDSPVYNKGISNELYNGRKNPGLTSNNNIDYRDLKNYNWIKDKLQNEVKPVQKLERPCTRGGDQRGLDFSFIDKPSNEDFPTDGSYFDRPVTRSKPRRPASRQVRLNKRVNNLRGTRGDSESFRGGGELGE